MEKWIDVNDRLPDKNGVYLVYLRGGVSAVVLSYATNLFDIDPWQFFNFPNRPGWYRYDNEYGYIETKNVTHWMPLPDPPATV